MSLLNAEQVCQMLQVKKSYLYHLTHNNRIPYLKIGNHLRFSEEDLWKWLEERKNGGDQDDGLQEEE